MTDRKDFRLYGTQLRFLRKHVRNAIEYLGLAYKYVDHSKWIDDTDLQTAFATSSLTLFTASLQALCPNVEFTAEDSAWFETEFKRLLDMFPKTLSDDPHFTMVPLSQAMK